MTINIKTLLDRVATWPDDDIAVLEEFVRLIEARRTGVYRLSNDERSAIAEGIAQAERGEFVSDEEMEAFWKRCGVL